ncbi:MAG: HAD family hydrolase [Rhodospirillaceae bacterium]|jgi:phosphoglycolate phosphatase|nr:HAD family hydrolase [Rhodospirillaceae bacterium]
MIRCVAFDFDGTLVRSNLIKRRSFYDVVADRPGAGDILDDLFASEFKGDRYEVFQELFQRLNPEWPPDQCRQEGRRLAITYGELCQACIRSCDEVPGASELLTELKRQSINAYVVSATPERDLLPIVRDRGYDHFFSGIFGRPKGKVEHLENILARENISSAELVMVGDGDDDRAAADAIKCGFIGIANTGNGSLRQADAMIEDLRPLLGLILNGPAEVSAETTIKVGEPNKNV